MPDGEEKPNRSPLSVSAFLGLRKRGGVRSPILPRAREGWGEVGHARARGSLEEGSAHSDPLVVSLPGDGADATRWWASSALPHAWRYYRVMVRCRHLHRVQVSASAPSPSRATSRGSARLTPPCTLSRQRRCECVRVAVLGRARPFRNGLADVALQTSCCGRMSKAPACDVLIGDPSLRRS